MRGLTLTVSQLNEYVRRSLASDPILHGVVLTGEISNFKRHASGHWYFSLKDEEAAISCAMFRQNTFGVRFRPENGQQVRLYGSVGLYTKTGSYQFYADDMEPEGIGELYRKLEALKNKLSAEGLFDTALKQPLPLLPAGVGIITSKTGAVVHDIARVAWRRYAGMPLYLCPVKVQGEGAAEEIAAALRLMDRFDSVDVIIVGRGGGSMEDLWPFNEECVARAIASCRKPVVSAVGHETDYTIADLVADLRAPTPSAAAELAVPEYEALLENVDLLLEKIDRASLHALSAKGLRLAQLQQRLSACSPAKRSERIRAEVEACRMRIETRLMQGLLQRRLRLEQLGPRMEWLVQKSMAERRNRLERASLKLRSSGPMETMKRGYAVITGMDGKIRSANHMQTGERIFIRMADGQAAATVDSVQRES